MFDTDYTSHSEIVSSSSSKSGHSNTSDLTAVTLLEDSEVLLMDNERIDNTAPAVANYITGMWEDSFPRVYPL